MPLLHEHVLKNVYDEATVEVRGEIDAAGNFNTLMNQYEVVSLEGDNYIYCETCNKRVSPGDGHGLSEEWTVM